MPDVDIIIVGGGPAGLSTAGALKSLGREAVVLDKGDRIGSSWLRRYDRLHLHTVRAFSGLAHFPIPGHFPKYLSKDQFAQYLQDYAEHFELKCIPNTSVRRVAAATDGSAHSLIVETESETWRCRTVVIAIGQYGTPILPTWPGLMEYEGRVVHSVIFKRGQEFAGQRVLVVGIGNSGAEIAADLAEQGAAFVAISIRTPPSIVPRDFLGTPVQVFGIALSRFPTRLADWIGARLARLALGDLTRYGLKRPAWRPFTAKRVPVIDVGFIKEVKNGRVKVRPNLAHFTRTGVMFEDGQEEAYDVVIAATGFKSGLAELLEVKGLLDEKEFPLNPQSQPTAQPGLFFMGYIETHRGHLYEAELASRRLAKVIENYLSE